MNKKLVSILQILLAIGFTGFWIMFFLEDSCINEHEKVYQEAESCGINSDYIECIKYLSFENAFPVPDLIWITPLLIIGAIGNFRNKKIGIVSTLLAGSSLVFLGLLDITFNLQNDRYTVSIMDGVLNGFINLVCIIFGPFLIYFSWKEIKE